MRFYARFSWVMLTAFLVLAVSALNAIPAFADDGDPPPPEAPAAEVTSTDAEAADTTPADVASTDDVPTDGTSEETISTEGIPADVPSTDITSTDAVTIEAAQTDIAPTDVTPTDITPTDAMPIDVAPPVAAVTDVTPTDIMDTASSDVASTDPAAVPELLDQVPAGTDLVVLDANGEILPLATQDAAQAISTNDPIWCPTGIAPRPGIGGCSDTFNMFDDGGGGGLLSVLSNKTVNGTIWVLGSYDSSTAGEAGNVILNGSSLGTTANYALTIKGGWTGAATGVIDITDPSEFNGDSLAISNWNADVTLSDILITGATGTGLVVTTTKNITLTRVEASGNTGRGASLSNDTGTGNVTVRSSTFNDNDDDGLNIDSAGAITLTDVTASENGIADGSGYGAVLDNSYGANPGKAVTLTGTNIFNHNDDYGLEINSYGAITINNLIANSNLGLYGTYLDNSSATTAQAVTLTGSSQFKYNTGGDGLNIHSKGAVTLNNITANQNSGYAGVTINNSSGSANVSLTGTNSFSNNDGRGLWITSNGAITASNLTAYQNAGDVGVQDGVLLDNQASVGNKPVTLTGINSFTSNYDGGLKVTSNGAIILSNVTAINSFGGIGVELDNTYSTNATPKPVTISGTNVFSDNASIGLKITTYGAVTLNNIKAEGNSAEGVKIKNDGALSTLPATVTLTGVNTFNDNDKDGLLVQSIGAIKLNSANADNNVASGIGTAGVKLDNSGGVNAGVTVSGTNWFYDNYYNGIYIVSNGAISLNSVTATNNGDSVSGSGDGAYVDNSSSTTGAGVTLTGTNVFNYNYTHGLEITSKGAIITYNVTAKSQYDGVGVLLDNCIDLGSGCTTSAPRAVAMYGVNVVDNNYSSGVAITSSGAVTVNSLTSYYNGRTGGLFGYGLSIDNNNTGALGNVTLSGTNALTYNYNDGLIIRSNGAILINNLDASDNGVVTTYYGANLDNTTAATAQNVALTGTNTFNNNKSGGLKVVSHGTITLNNVTADSNGVGTAGDGVNLDNSSSTTGAGVTLTGRNYFNYNYSNGLAIESKGAISTYYLTAYNNANGSGAYLDNCVNTGAGCTASAPRAVTMYGVNNFNDNYYTGLVIKSSGAVTVYSITANTNGVTGSTNGHGLWIDNNDTGALGNVTLSGTNTLSSNYYNGLYVVSNGAITLNNVTANSNGQVAGYYGASLDNGTAATPLNVTLTGTNTFNSNKSGGLKVVSKGAITTYYVTANNNTAGAGVNLDNCIDTGSGCTTTPKVVTMAGVNFSNNNYFSGTEILSSGAVTVSSLTSYSNGTSGGLYGYGLYIDNNNTGALGNVTLSGTNNLNNNYFDGLYVVSNGAIALNNVTANSNGQVAGHYGASLNNSTAATPQNVTLTGTNIFNNNKTGGLKVVSKGAITTYYVTANNNTAGAGVSLDNCIDTGSGCTTTPKAVTMAGVNFSNNNYFSGIEIRSNGAVTVNSLTSYSNGTSGGLSGYGLWINNNDTGALGNVTLSGTNNLNNNYFDGLYVVSNGAIALNNVTAGSNGQVAGHYGASLNNSTAATPQNVTLTGTNIFNNNKTGGLKVTSIGAISTNNLTASNNTAGTGVSLDNCNDSGSGCAAVPKAVTMTGVNVFNYNYLSGIEIISSGAVTVNNLTSYYNGRSGGLYGYGLRIDNNNTGALGNVTLSGTNSLTYNYSDNLEVFSNGAILANTLTANNSITGYGANLNNNSTVTTLNVTLTGTNTFNGNKSGGLKVVSKGAITTYNITASSNSAGGGVSLNNCVDLGSGCTAAPKAVSMYGTNTASYNYYSGVEIISSGAVTVSSLSAVNNGISGGLSGYGLYIDNNNTGALGNVTLSGTNRMNNNYQGGLYVFSNGAITLNNVTAGASVTENGAYLDNSTSTSGAGVTLTGKNYFNNNYSNGLVVHSTGAISTYYLTASSNSHGMGANLDNTSATSPKSVTLSGVNLSEYNYSSGIEIFSLGAVTINSLTSYYNGSSGGLYGYGLKIDNNNTGALGNVTLSGTNSLTYNYSDGLEIFSNGAILINTLTSSDNTTGFGAELDNSTATSAKNVTLTGTNIFNNNEGSGLKVVSVGAISLNNLTASSNDGVDGGISLNNSGASLPQPVTISTKVWVDYSDGRGLTVASKGAITISNLTAKYNGSPLGGGGVKLDNTSGSPSTPYAVSLLGTNLIQNNYGVGLDIDATGAISVYNLTSSGNSMSGYGADLRNTTLGTGAVTLTGVNKFENNNSYGLTIHSLGTISLSSVIASGNNGNGAELVNTTGTLPNVTLSGTNVFSSNSGYGLLVTTYGTVTLSNVTASSNGTSGTGDGASITNTGGPLAKNVALTGTNTFNYNGDAGLVIASIGSISVSNLTANGNSLEGAKLNNNNPSSTGTVTISGFGTFNFNGATGLFIETFGAVTLNKITANDNHPARGVDIDNHLAATPQPVTLTGVNTFFSNGTDGLWVESIGAITLYNITANENGAYGAHLQNDYSGTSLVTLNGVNNFLDNNNTGLYILSNGNVSAAKVTADGNVGGDGMYTSTVGNVTLTCGNFANNGIFGLEVDGTTPTALLQLIGVISSGHTTDIDTSGWAGLISVVRNCP